MPGTQMTSSSSELEGPARALMAATDMYYVGAVGVGNRGTPVQAALSCPGILLSDLEVTACAPNKSTQSRLFSESIKGVNSGRQKNIYSVWP